MVAIFRVNNGSQAVCFYILLTQLTEPPSSARQLGYVNVSRGKYSKCQYLLDSNVRGTIADNPDIVSSPQVISDQFGASLAAHTTWSFSGPCNSFYCLGHFKNVYDDDDDDDGVSSSSAIVEVGLERLFFLRFFFGLGLSTSLPVCSSFTNNRFPFPILVFLSHELADERPTRPSLECPSVSVWLSLQEWFYHLRSSYGRACIITFPVKIILQIHLEFNL